MNKTKQALGMSKYFWTFLISSAFFMWLYMGPLTIVENYSKPFIDMGGLNGFFMSAVAWTFAIGFPMLIGLIIATQWYNLKEVKTCSAGTNAASGIATVIGLATVGCPLCPLIFLSWFGLAAGASGAFFRGPWIKVISMAVLGFSLKWANK